MSDMRHALVLHPNSVCQAVTRVEIDITRDRSGLVLLHYFVAGDPMQLSPSPAGAPTKRRADELWLHTCFEVFLRPVGEDGYAEFNLAPTLDWQAYRLTGYRQGRQEADVPSPVLDSRLLPHRCEFSAAVTLTGVLPEMRWNLAASAVIEDTSGRISYWALAHPPGKPDFHHADGFMFALEAP